MLIQENERILIAKVLNFKVPVNKRNNPQLLKLSFYSSELKSNVHIAKILSSIKDNTSIVENPEEIDSKTIKRYWNTLKNLALVTGTVDNPELTEVADHYINAYNKKYKNEGERNRFFQSENIIAIEYEVVKNLIELVSIKESHKNYLVFLEIWYNIQLFFSYLPTNKEEMDSILDDKDLLFFLYRINANGWEIARYFQLSPEDQKDFRNIFDKYSIDATEEKLINRVKNTEELFSQINNTEEKILVKYLEATNNIQADIRYRIYALINAFYQLKKEGKLPLIDNQYRIYKNTNTYNNYTKTVSLNESTALSIELPYQLIIQGCPGSGKSFYAHSIATRYANKIIRTQFHPETSYFDFIGSYKPVPVYEKSDNIIVNIESKPFELGRPLIDYQYNAGFMLQALLYAYQQPNEVIILLIEEINRGEVSSIFGDFFQLLDRQEDGCSRFPIECTNEQKGFFLTNGLNVDKLYLPSNLFIIATMNSADQGVFPLDTAFKRRWSFMYRGYLEKCKYDPESQKLLYGNKIVNWDTFRNKLNDILLNNDIHEDRLIGPYFLSEKELSNPKEILEKLLMYLWDDVLRFKQEVLFNVRSFSALIEVWDNGRGAPLKIDFDAEETNDNDIAIQTPDEINVDNKQEITEELLDLLESDEQ